MLSPSKGTFGLMGRGLFIWFTRGWWNLDSWAFVIAIIGSTSKLIFAIQHLGSCITCFPFNIEEDHISKFQHCNACVLLWFRLLRNTEGFSIKKHHKRMYPHYFTPLLLAKNLTKIFFSYKYWLIITSSKKGKRSP